MSRFNFTGLHAIIKALYSTTTKDDTKAIIISDKVKNDTTIEFKNGSYIKVLMPKEECARGKRSKIIYPLYNDDGTVDYHFDKEMLDEVLTPFCKERESNDIDGQILYVSSNKKLDKTTLSNVVNDEFREQYDTSATFHDVINYLLFSEDEIGEKEVVHCLSALSDLITGLQQERIDKINSYAEKLFGGGWYK